MKKWVVPLSDIDFRQEETLAVQQVINSGWLTMGEKTVEFEQDFGKFIDVKYAFAVANGTVALHMACLAAGIGPGDEVILPALTFVATANAVLYCGAKPVFADVVSLDDFTISLESIKKLKSPRTKAIIVMHYGGYPCHMEEILLFARENKLILIEDAAHAPGASLYDIRMGAWGDIGCFSFFANKNMTTGEGGMVTTNDGEMAEKLKKLRSHGMTSLTWDRHKGHAWSYDVVSLGFNYRIDEIHSALGIEQLKKLVEFNDKRKNIVQDYQTRFLSGIPEMKIPFLNHPGQSAYHLMPVLLPPSIDRIVFMEHMKTAGIQTSFHYPPIYKFSYHKGVINTKDIDLSITEEIANREVTLPLYPKLKMEEVQFVVNTIRMIFDILLKDQD
ncbi:MAG: DegT/DnrJ/EryC1/StrS aminotransferase [Anaerolineaceae bacterium]|nr:DegT/DnrJ/EryC1/StrS aminotransferase [Anaerolineaceae bacterium]